MWSWPKFGQHRGAGLPDLLIAALAERAGLPVVHYDADFDQIAAVTGQPMQWVVPGQRLTPPPFTYSFSVTRYSR